jgi:UDP-2-acetamido-3-amino-2,3-dideoxy-glucuronate N-acetyltransferase
MAGAAQVPEHDQVTSSPLSALEWFGDPGAAADLGIGGAMLVRLHAVFESRGQLTAGELGRGLPFVPRRIFVISKVPDVDIRGEHAHRELQQLLVCLAGSVVAEVSDGERSRSVKLDCPQAGLYIPPMVWGVQHHYTHDAVLLVLASREYDPSDYIRDFSEFALLRGKRGLA